MKRSLFAILLLALALAAAGCGGDDDDGGGGATDQDAAAQATRDYLTAYTEGDGAAACAQITEAAQQALEAAAVQAAERQGSEKTFTCEEILTRAAGAGGQSAEFLKPVIDSIDAEDVSVEGDRAEVDVEAASVPIVVENVDGEWLISEETVRQSFQLGQS